MLVLSVFMCLSYNMPREWTQLQGGHMILSDGEIKKRILNDKLLEFHDPEKIKYCGCELTLGKVVAPNTGEVLSLEVKKPGWLGRIFKGPKFRTRKCFVIKPSETMILVTTERLNMPNDLCATYGQLNRLANMGLMILNTSIVEPGYSGQLSCILVNFSSQKHSLAPGDSIAKINFHTIQGLPEKLFSQSYNPDEYERMVSKGSINLPQSLLDISGVEERVTEKIGTTVRRSIAFGGVLILILLLWSQMEGFFSEWLYKRAGIPDTKMQIEKSVEDRIKAQQEENKKQNEDLKREILDLKNQIKKAR